MNALPIVIGSLCIFVIAYRFYGAFLATKVLVLEEERITPAHTMEDGHNYFPTNKWVLFGHHFAAIAGAGPLIGPVLAAQFGYLPGLLWILIGAVIAGGVHDMVVLVASIRHEGKSIAEIARKEISPLSGIICEISIIIIIIITLAGVGLAVVNSMKESPWGVFTIGSTVPIAFFMGLYMYRFRKGKIAEATVIGVILLLLAVIGGKWVADSPLRDIFTLEKEGVTLAMALYGFIASVFPVWMLLCPRDYLSTFMKLGTILLLSAGIIIVHPNLFMPPVTEYIHGGGPVLPGKVFPFVFITIACGAVSGFHALISSGTTPKMVDKEPQARFIGYGAMMAEAFVAVIALIAACSLHPGDYFAINVSQTEFQTLEMSTVDLASLSQETGEKLEGRPGGAVTLAVGMAQIFSNIRGLEKWMSYWYHFAIMFEALFILTLIDTGTRVARFLLQESMGKFYKPFEKTGWMPGTVISSALIVFAWAYLIYTGSISTIWPVFGVSNQLLSAIALCIGTTVIIKLGKGRYIWTTLIPMCFLTVTTLWAGFLLIKDKFLPMTDPVIAATLAETAGKTSGGVIFQGYLNSFLISFIMLALITIIIDSAMKWKRFFYNKPSITEL